jgi:hypothetical protein
VATYAGNRVEHRGAIGGRPQQPRRVPQPPVAGGRGGAQARPKQPEDRPRLLDVTSRGMNRAHIPRRAAPVQLADGEQQLLVEHAKDFT